MKVLLVSLILLVAGLLLPPSEVRAERDILEERRKRETLTYVLNETHSVEAYPSGNNHVVIVRVFPQNNAGKKVDVTGDIIPSTVSCRLGPDGKIIHGSNYKGRQTRGKRETIDCSRNRENQQRVSPKEKKRDEEISRPVGYLKVKGPDNLWKVCQMCQNLYDINAFECRIDGQAARRCVNRVKEVLNTIEQE